MDVLDRCKQPLIGLRHIHKYETEDGQLIFWCGLCEMSCGSNLNVVVAHAIMKKHRVNYMKLNYLNYYDEIQNHSNDHSLVLEYSRIIEEEEGRQNLRVCEGPIPALVLRSREMESTADESGEVHQGHPIFLDDASIGQALHRIALKSDAKNVGSMLKPMVSNLITNDMEAAKALEVANRLTRALLEYRLAGQAKQ